ncbi:FG-GAP-like repeat-containing protein [Bizionia sediminis]|uniref:FG-GAP-like repeat-containing protein n=1 Tax=Bizionia sediminis TaxID=1737064 RepID=A0ABW5KT65_9FLAO
MKNHYFILGFILVSNVMAAQVVFSNQALNAGIIATAGDTYLGNGISFCDYNNDGWDDITIATQNNAPVLFFKNRNGTFEADALNIPANTYQHKQVIWVDIDNDGDKDLFVTANNGPNKLYENLGDLNFQDISTAAGFSSENLESYGASWGDYNNDGYLDLFLSNRSESNSQRNYFFRNNGNNTFTDVTEEAGFDLNSHMTFCAAFFDFNNDGWQDLYLSSDKYFNQNFLYQNNGDGTFTDVSVPSNTGIIIDAMSTTIGDFNNDGWFDLYITNTPADGNVLFRNNGDGTFTDLAVFSGTRLYSYAWGAVFLDADNDMDEDLYVSCEFDGSNPPYQSSAFFQNRGNNTFANNTQTAVSGDAAKSYANAVGDFNNDGLPDIAVSNINYENIYLWENQTTTSNNWLKVTLEGVESNRDGIGSRIEISVNGLKQYRYTISGEGYLSQNSSAEIFGLGNSSSIDYIRVTWLSGTVDYIENVAANQSIHIQEGSNTLNAPQTPNWKVSFYPNPVKNKLVLNAPTPITAVHVYTLLGQKVLETAAQNSQIAMDVSALNTGVYMVKVFSKTAINTFQIIKE